MSFRLHYIVILVIFVIIPKTTVCTRTGNKQRGEQIMF